MTTGLYVFRTSLPIVNQQPAFPQSYSLGQNFPNPFNPSTTIKIELPESSYASLTVYNAAGQKVMTLLDGFTLKGIQSISFDASGLPSGIYFYKLVTPKFTESRKMAFVK